MGEKKSGDNRDAEPGTAVEGDKDWVSFEKSMPNLVVGEPRGRFVSMEEKWKLIYNETCRAPTYSVSHYISYLRRYVTATGQLRVAVSGKTTERFNRKEDILGFHDKSDKKTRIGDTQKSLDSISPMSYFIRKLKLDLKMAFLGFVEEFIAPPSNGLRLLVSLLKNLQVLSTGPADRLFAKVGTAGTLKKDEYKKNMIDEQDCLLCIKYTLRAERAVAELLEYSPGLLTVTDSVLSNFSKSRITALEILTLLLTGPSSVDRVLDAFTSLRIKQAESCRFKMLVNMLYTRGVSHVLFQVSCLRMLNMLANLCKSANMRVFLQFEVEEAGLDLDRIEQNALGVGLEYDDLRKEILEWRKRYIDVDALLRKMKAEIKLDVPGVAVNEFNYDQQFGRRQDPALKSLDGLPQTHHNSEPIHWRDTKQPVMEAPPPQIPPRDPYPAMRRRPISPNPVQVAKSGIPTNSLLANGVGKLRGEHLPDTILSQAPSASNPKPTKALDVGTFGRDFGSGFSAMTAELWEPYGMVINPETTTASRAAGQNSSSAHSDQNWTLSSPDHRNGRREARKGTSRSAGDNRYQRSRSSERYNDNHGRADNNAFVSNDISRLFYSPKDSGLESGPLRWFNPGITLPPSPSSSRKTSDSHDSKQKATRSEQKTLTELFTKRQQVPSPVHKKLPTPPPDYDSDPEGYSQGSPRRKFSAAPFVTSNDAIFRYAGEDTSAFDIPPYYTSTLNSNFQRRAPVRRKSFSELSSQLPPSSEASTRQRTVSDSPSPPPILKPRAVQNSAKPLNTTATAPNTDGSLKNPAARYVKHTDTKPVHGSNKHPSPDYTHADFRRENIKHPPKDYPKADIKPTESAMKNSLPGYTKTNVKQDGSDWKHPQPYNPRSDTKASNSGMKHPSPDYTPPLSDNNNSDTESAVTKANANSGSLHQQSRSSNVNYTSGLPLNHLPKVSQSLTQEKAVPATSSTAPSSDNRSTKVPLKSVITVKSNRAPMPPHVDSRNSTQNSSISSGTRHKQTAYVENVHTNANDGETIFPVHNNSRQIKPNSPTHGPAPATTTQDASSINTVISTMIRSKRLPPVQLTNYTPTNTVPPLIPPPDYSSNAKINSPPIPFPHTTQQNPSSFIPHPLKPSGPHQQKMEPQQTEPTHGQPNATSQFYSQTHPHINIDSAPATDLTQEERRSTAPPDRQNSLSPTSGLKVHGRKGSDVSYTDELGLVLGDLDQALESHGGWQSASTAQQPVARQPTAPLVAYV